jgi:plastocyanin
MSTKFRFVRDKSPARLLASARSERKEGRSPPVRNGRSGSRAGVYAAIIVIAVTVAVGVVGLAYAVQDQTIHADDGIEFTPSQVTIQVGEKVTWTFDNPNTAHNVVAKPDSPKSWSTGDGVPSVNHAEVGPITFNEEGTYTFYCQVHGGMQGTVIVGDAGTPSPDPSPSPSPSPSPTPSPQPGHATTPPPSPGTDTVKPTVSSVKLKALRRAVRVQFRLSETATVTVRVKRGRKVLASKRVQAGAGTHAVTVRSKRLQKGRYTISIQARDAFGNRSRLATKRLTLRR